jgi:hypothetical protein
MLKFWLQGVLSIRLVHGREMKPSSLGRIGRIDKEHCSIALNMGQTQAGD